MHSWHISTATTAIIMVMIVIMVTVAPTIAAFLILAILPCLIWLGWTLRERSWHKELVLEERIRNEGVNPKNGLRRKVNLDDVSVRRSNK
ncbi:MAG: hypothetical protein AAF846_22260 [Chloroflexota bacterium]